jgi:hypothetical protein
MARATPRRRHRGPATRRGASLGGAAAGRAALGAAFLAELPVPGHDPEQVRRTAEAVLSRPEFADRRSPVQIAADWLWERFLDLLDAILTAATGGGIWAIAIMAVFLAIVAAVGVLVWRVLRGVTADPGQAAGSARALRPATDWRAEAEAHERAGAWRQALRCRYRALVADLAARGVVEEVPGTTAGEYRAQVRLGSPAAAGDFDGATELFELAWYGDVATGAPESARFRDLADRALSAAAR